jgi:hypothetical protein
MAQDPDSILDRPDMTYVSYSTSAPTDTPDIPVDLRGFESNVRICSWSTGLFTVLGLVLEVIGVRITGKNSSVWQWITIGFQVRNRQEAVLLLIYN